MTSGQSSANTTDTGQDELDQCILPCNQVTHVQGVRCPYQLDTATGNTLKEYDQRLRNQDTAIAALETTLTQLESTVNEMMQEVHAGRVMRVGDHPLRIPQLVYVLTGIVEDYLQLDRGELEGFSFGQLLEEVQGHPMHDILARAPNLDLMNTLFEYLRAKIPANAPPELEIDESFRDSIRLYYRGRRSLFHFVRNHPRCQRSSWLNTFSTRNMVPSFFIRYVDTLPSRR